MITDISQLDPKGTYTYADYLTWRFEESLELIRGHIYKMSSAPRTTSPADIYATISRLIYCLS